MSTNDYLTLRDNYMNELTELYLINSDYEEVDIDFESNSCTRKVSLKKRELISKINELDEKFLLA